MTNTAIELSTSSADLLLAGLDKAQQKDQYSRLSAFSAWLDGRGGRWHMPDLASYRDYLLGERGLAPSSVATHLSTIRGGYHALLTDNAARQRLYDAVSTQGGSASDRKAFVDETIERLKNDIEPNKSKVTVIKEQDAADSKHLRLTVAQAKTLLEAPFDHATNTPLQAYRDTAILALMLCTGIREMELWALDVADLRQTLGGALALHVRKGKGSKARLVVYGEMDWCLAYVDKWLEIAGITEGSLFRGFSNRGRSFRRDSSRLTLRAVQDILNRYPISIGGALVGVNPHDLRRTYARRLYDAGVDKLAIQQNLGHADSHTTEGYIGILDADQRRPPRVFRPPHMDKLKIS